MSTIHRLQTQQFIAAPLETVWQFMSSPKNLKYLTPKSLGMEILNNSAEGEMYPGMVISYKVAPVAGIKMRWVTEITHVEKLRYFVDEQRFGPYAFWHHKHFLEEKNGGVLMTDIVDYKVPFGILGRVVNRILVRKKLQEIFAFRKAALEGIFPSPAQILPEK